MAATFEDLKHQSVSLHMALAAAALGILSHFMWPQSSHLLWLSGILPGILLLFTAWITHQEIGYGDGLVLAVTGLCLGFSASVFILMAGLLFLAPVSLFYLVCKKAGRKKTLPFIPFLTAGYLLWLAINIF